MAQFRFEERRIRGADFKPMKGYRSGFVEPLRFFFLAEVEPRALSLHGGPG
jgi:hypothetical protein